MSEPRVRIPNVDIPQSAKQKIEPSFTLNAAALSKTVGASSEAVATTPPLVDAPTKQTVQSSSAQVLKVATKVVPPSNQQPFSLEPSSPRVTSTSLPETYVPDELALKAAESGTESDDVNINHSSVAQQSFVRLPVSLPVVLHTAMDWVALMDAPLGVMLSQLETFQADIRTFKQHTALWVQAESGLWEDLLKMNQSALQSHTPVWRVACALQLADRSGPVDAETLDRFKRVVESRAKSLGLPVVWQGDYAPQQQAQKIDTFAIEVDKTVEFHLMAVQGAFHATKLRGLAEASGMYLTDKGRFDLFNNLNQLEFSLRNYEGKPFSAEMLKTAVLTAVTFQLEIPTTLNSVQVFDHMLEVATTMAQSLNATITDVNRRPLGDVQLEKIRQQLKIISENMAAQGILPGSPHALRLFS